MNANLDFIEISVWFSRITRICTWMIISFDCLFTFFRKWIFFFDCAPNKKWRISWVKWRWNDFYPIFQNSTMILSNCFSLKWCFITGVILKCSKARERVGRVFLIKNPIQLVLWQCDFNSNSLDRCNQFTISNLKIHKK